MRSLLLSASALIALPLALSACSAAAQDNTTDTAMSARTPVTPKQVEDPYYVSAAEAVNQRAGEDFQPRAKNVILFVGDGMGVSTVTAARIYAGQQRGLDGESYKLAMETLPQAAFSKTYSHDSQISDSAATATAMVTGVKVNSRTLSVNSDTAYGNCASAQGKSLDSLFEYAEEAGLSTGIISTARITHATPASTYAKSADRNWEDDSAFGDRADPSCPDIARQLIDWPAGDGFELALGGGRAQFMTVETTDPEYEDKTGARSDEDLMAAWAAKSDDHTVITDSEGFEAIDFDSDIKVLGLFEPSHMQYALDREEDPAGEPSLEELTRAAITRLSRNEDGYMLMVEGGRVDHAHHGVNAARALGDADALDQAVAAAMEMADMDETLIIVTADHSHTMTIAGYSRRGNPILGTASYGPGMTVKAGDGLPYTTLGYANGQTGCQPGSEDCSRPDVSDVDTTDKDYRQQALVYMGSETHAGEDVPVFSGGPGSELVRGVIEQNELFHIMGRATGLVAAPMAAEEADGDVE